MDVRIYCQRKKMQRDYHTNLPQHSAGERMTATITPAANET